MGKSVHIYERTKHHLEKDYIWRTTDQIDRGGFGRIYRGIDRKTGEAVAIKMEVVADNNKYDEINILKSIQCSYIVKYITSEQFLISSNRLCRMTVCELANCSLASELKEPANYFGLPWRILFKVINHIDEALCYLEKNCITHRDVKPGNILIFKNPELTFKLCDFGISKRLKKPNQELTTVCGTVGYMNHNIVKTGLKRGCYPYTGEDADNWSFACTIFECATGMLPFTAPNENKRLQLINMCNRNTVYGYVNSDGKKEEYVICEHLPATCRYSRSLKNLLCVFFRCFFGVRVATDVSNSRSTVCKKLVLSPYQEYYDLNSISVVEHFSSSELDLQNGTFCGDICQQKTSVVKDGKTLILDLTSLTAKDFESANRDSDAKVPNHDKCTLLSVMFTPNKSVAFCCSAFKNVFLMHQELKQITDALKCGAIIWQIDYEICRKEKFLSDVLYFMHSFIGNIQIRIDKCYSELLILFRLYEAISVETEILCFLRPEEERIPLRNNIETIKKEHQTLKVRYRELKSSLNQLEISLRDAENKNRSSNHYVSYMDIVREKYLELLHEPKNGNIQSEETGSCEELTIDPKEDETAAVDKIGLPKASADIAKAYMTWMQNKYVELWTAYDSITERCKSISVYLGQLTIGLHELSVALRSLEENIEDSRGLLRATRETNEQRFKCLVPQALDPVYCSIPEKLSVLKEHAKEEFRKAKQSCMATKVRFGVVTETDVGV